MDGEAYCFCFSLQEVTAPFAFVGFAVMLIPLFSGSKFLFGQFEVVDATGQTALNSRCFCVDCFHLLLDGIQLFA